MRKRGFTLIELLVVIAIIAILAAILFPVFSNAKAAAKKTACMSNMHQLSSAWTLYTDSSNGSCPALVTYYDNVPKTWMQTMLPYVKNCQVFGCAASNFIPTSVDQLDGNQPAGSKVIPGQLTYGWNANVFNYPWPPYNFVVKVGDLDRPTKTVFLCDSVYADWVGLPGSTSISWNDTRVINGKNVYWARPSDRHNGSVNVAFADGHAGSIQYKELIKTEPGNHRRVVAWKYGSTPGWSTNETTIFPYFQTSASGGHL